MLEKRKAYTDYRKMITKHLMEKGEMYAAGATYAMNTFASPALSGCSSLDVVFVYKPPDLLNSAFPPLRTIC